MGETASVASPVGAPRMGERLLAFARKHAIGFGIGLLAAAGVFLFCFSQNEATLLTWTLGLSSSLVLISWVWLSWLFRGVDLVLGEDPANQYEIGAYSVGVLMAVPAGLNVLWLLMCVVIIVSRAVLHQPVFTATLRWHAAAFAAANIFGIFLNLTRSIWLFWYKGPQHG